MNKESLQLKIGQSVVRLRSARNWSQSDLARASSKDRQSIERLENGRVNPTAYYLQEIAQALQVPLSRLLE